MLHGLRLNENVCLYQPGGYVRKGDATNPFFGSVNTLSHVFLAHPLIDSFCVCSHDDRGIVQPGGRGAVGFSGGL